MIAIVLLLPLIIAGLAIFSLVSFLQGNRKCAFCIFVAAAILNLYGESFPLNIIRIINSHRTFGDEITVSTFNINSSGDDFQENYEKIVSQLESTGSSVVLINECQSMSNKVKHSFDSLMRMYYQYTTFDGNYYRDNVFYSKNPISSIDIIKTGHGNYFPIISVDVGGYYVNMVGCHMNSNNYVDPQTRLSPEEIRTKEAAKLYWQTLCNGSRRRMTEADSICSAISDSSNLIVLGDMNDVSGSYPLRKLKSLGLKDAWWKLGVGLGGTRSVLFYPFRIDHILYGNNFKLIDVFLTDQGLSDHKQLTARFKIKEKIQ